MEPFPVIAKLIPKADKIKLLKAYWFPCHGEPILINKDGKPINLIDEKNNDNPKISYPFLNKNYKKNERRNNKKKTKKR